PRSTSPTSFDASVILGRTAEGTSTAPNRWLSGFDDRSRAAMRQRAAAALAAGQRLDVMAKLGDSITSSPSYLTQVTVDTILNSPYAGLAGTLRFFSRTLVPDGLAVPTIAGSTPLVPSPARRSLGSDDRWYVTDLLTGGDVSALVRELESIRPGIAVVMFGTNDLTLTTVEAFEEHLNTLLQELEQRHVLPILSTIPARQDQTRYGERVPTFNAAIRAMAAVHQVPLMEYGAAMAGLPNAGLSADGIHPSVCPAGAGSLSPECLRYGYNMRNLLTLLALDKLQQTVLADPAYRITAHAETGQ
ncbi:MAG: SGNH/GDSL hydrolase family protein, partial [Dehalococcoidia bacterium]